MTTQQERRRHQRTSPDSLTVEVILKAGPDQIVEAPEKTITVRVDNVSDGGACIVSREPFELGQVVSFASSEIPGNTGVIIWTSRSKNESKAGVKFDG